MRLCGAVASFVLLTSHSAFGQDRTSQPPATRQEQLRQEREQKATSLTPYQPGAVEQVLVWVEGRRAWERLLNPAEGFYPKVGTVTVGGGFGMGVGYRKPRLFGERANLETVAIGSLSRYWRLEAQLILPDLADGAGFSTFYVRRFEYPQETFFGLGPDSLRAHESDYTLRGTEAGATGGLRVGPWIALGGRAEFSAPDVGPGRSPDLVPVHVQFSPAEAPGLVLQPNFGHYEAAIVLNTRQPRGNPRRGLRYSISGHRYQDLDLDRFSFNRIDLEAQHFFGFLNDRRVIALRALVSVSDADAGNEIPFYLQRTLGGPDDLRGFKRFRFRDKHLMVLNAEYRWEVFTAMDAAIFYDAGKVASRAKDLSFDDLETDYGFGVRFGTDGGVFLRIEGAYGSREGPHFVLRFGDVF
jgi:hypothetical protein